MSGCEIIKCKWWRGTSQSCAEPSSVCIYQQQDAAIAALKAENERLQHTNAHLKMALEESFIDSHAIEAGECMFEKALDEALQSLAALRAENERLTRVLLEKGWHKEVVNVQKKLAAAEKRERELRELLREIDEYYVLEAEHYERIGRLLGGERGCDD